MSCSGSHLGFWISIKNPNFLEDLQMIIPGQFGFNCPSALREEAVGNRLTFDPMGKCSNAFFSETTNMIKPNCTRMFISTNFTFFVPV
jgi:hypothetical protein